MQKYLFGLMAILALTLAGCGSEDATPTKTDSSMEEGHSEDDGHDHGAEGHDDEESHEGHDH